MTGQLCFECQTFLCVTHTTVASFVQGDSGRRSVFWELIVSVIVRKIFYMTIYLILNVYRDRAVLSLRGKKQCEW